ncbi:MAG TPA: tryptophan--tRNA ligase [Bacteroidales bacterium]|jgi:tryptophanyl-tRNA synthetase|nr:tryptophan--tRNA ligase [Bacteroidales bacterium]HOH83647.1 tryptophan--tRNA ligase [Bacteroidales bacterium]HPB25062.1 tryptophan--tRNA ligase [Bacteroidales bacterium]HPI30661.1 tryptophan--tRNA ligase [Bacteroidales bacterium]HQN16072.1 tryptophan--tRNA ligase [Bacteroidales bacterium]
MEIVVSGIRPTGNLHLGNYLGALQNFVKMQEENNCYFFIADYHSLTTHPTPADLHGNVRNVLVEYLASGLDPEKATIYIQSDVPETAELYLILNMNAYKGELERCTSFKEKARTQPENINAGLLTYPTLMAADIIIHKAAMVPVGKDQEQHLEMTRTFAKRFNRLYNVDYFPEPVAYNFGKNLIKIPGLDGSQKMSKSDNENSCIFLADTADMIRKKVMKAVTDAGPTAPNSPKPQVIENLFSLMKVVSTEDTIKHFDEQYNNCSIRYGDLKKQLAEDMIAFVSPITERIKALASDSDYLHKVACMGAEKARASAAKTVKEVREIIGFKKF